MKRVKVMNGVKTDPAPRVRTNSVRMLLDSGAYSAWSKGATIKLKDYGQYCLDNKKYVWRAVNLDVIPGKLGRRPSPKEVSDSAAASYENLLELKAMGVNAMPVFHQGEPILWLEKMLNDREDFIGLATLKTSLLEEQIRWLDMVWSLLTNKDGRPIVKAHGFGATQFDVMTCYPWYSVDSTTWSLSPGYGHIAIPPMQNGKFNYLSPPSRVVMSGIPNKSKSAQERQYEAMPEKLQAVIRQYVEERGSSVEEQRYRPNARRELMLVYYREFCEQLYDVRFKGHRARIFGPDHVDRSNMPALEPFHPLVFFATEAMHHDWSDMMNHAGARDRLLSYWYLKDQPEDTLQRYVTTGRYIPWVPQRQKINWGKHPGEETTYANRRRLKLFERIQRQRKQEESGYAEE